MKKNNQGFWVASWIKVLFFISTSSPYLKINATKCIVINFSIVFLAIESDYTGPCLQDGKVTLDFMKELMETYKQQGKLHRKYAYQVSQNSHFCFW